MEKRAQINIVIIVVLIVAVSAIGYNYFVDKKPDNNSEENTGLDAFAQCLTDSGLKMYGTEWCSHCKNQKARFGDSFQYVDYIDCDEEKDTCGREGIRGYPTWKFEGGAYPGEKELDWLGELVGC